MKRKILAVLLAGAMVLSLAACGGGDAGSTDSGSTDAGSTDAGGEASSDMKIAMITDSGDITDQSFNQTTYEASKAWAEGAGVEFNYYKPESDADEARSASIDQAIADGANVIICPGYLFEVPVMDQAELYPDVKFVVLDVAFENVPANAYCCTYQEELSGYMAGYGAVKLGYKHLGFLGGMSVPAVIRFGYGYVQGADAAAKELGIANEVQVEYVCGGQFYGDADITAYMDTWYGSKGVEVVFACGGGIYTSAAEAAVKTGGKLIGVDTDQSAIINEYADDLTITSAMKSLTTSVQTLLSAIKDGKWDDYAGKSENLGLVSENSDENFVQLPADTTLWGDGFTEDDYHTLVAAMYNGEIKVSDDTTAMPATEITVNDYGSIK